MALTVKRITLWRTEVDNRVGALATTLEPLARAGADLQVLMAYRYPGNEQRAAVEVYPVSGKKVTAAAQAAGLAAAPFPALLVEGDNRAGLGHALAQAIADAGINMTFQVAQVMGRRASAIIGFEREEDARKAATIIKKVAARKR
jgi:hypothetical protein